MLKLTELTQSKYESLKDGGMLFEFYPDATGNFEKDCLEPQINDEAVKDWLYEAFKSAAIESLTPKETKRKLTKVTRILFDGEFVTTFSNKTVWRQLGHAKSALKNHMTEIEYKQQRQVKNYLCSGFAEKFINSMVECGRLKFVEVDAAEFVKIKQGK